MRPSLLGKKPHSLAQYDRIDDEVQFVDQVALQQPAQQHATALKQKVTTGLGLELPDPRLDVARDDLGVLPRWLLESGRRHVLRQDIDPVRDRIAAIVLWPIAGPDVERCAPEQH